MVHFSADIKDNFAYYTRLVLERKTITHSPIVLDEQGSNAHYRTKKVPATHENLNDNIHFEVDSRIANIKYFHFKLMAKEFTAPPFFRYDSDGTAHRNRILGTEFHHQLVTTPHFHKFHESGIEIAFKNAVLEDPIQEKALEDITLAVANFCQEGNVRLNSDDFPEINQAGDEIGFDTTEDDPLAYIKF